MDCLDMVPRCRWGDLENSRDLLVCPPLSELFRDPPLLLGQCVNGPATPQLNEEEVFQELAFRHDPRAHPPTSACAESAHPLPRQLKTLPARQLLSHSAREMRVGVTDDSSGVRYGEDCFIAIAECGFDVDGTIDPEGLPHMRTEERHHPALLFAVLMIGVRTV